MFLFLKKIFYGKSLCTNITKPSEKTSFKLTEFCCHYNYCSVFPQDLYNLVGLKKRIGHMGTCELLQVDLTDC